MPKEDKASTFGDVNATYSRYISPAAIGVAQLHDLHSDRQQKLRLSLRQLRHIVDVNREKSRSEDTFLR